MSANSPIEYDEEGGYGATILPKKKHKSKSKDRDRGTSTEYSPAVWLVVVAFCAVAGYLVYMETHASQRQHDAKASDAEDEGAAAQGTEEGGAGKTNAAKLTTFTHMPGWESMMDRFSWVDCKATYPDGGHDRAACMYRRNGIIFGGGGGVLVAAILYFCVCTKEVRRWSQFSQYSE